MYQVHGMEDQTRMTILNLQMAIIIWYKKKLTAFLSNSNRLFVNLNKIILKLIYKGNGTKIAKTTLKK